MAPHMLKFKMIARLGAWWHMLAWFLVFLSYLILFCGKMDKLLYFSNGSTDFYEILRVDAAILKNVRLNAISLQLFDRF